LVHRLTILGPPRTKKNYSRIVRAGRRFRLLPSAAHEGWARSAMAQLQGWRRSPLADGVAVKAFIYRERKTGDLINYLQALADALERAGVVQNDRQIMSWDGSRLDKDARRPRIEVDITSFSG
jgi:Holliday junction resolvase RusA-like endonuclease